MPIVKFWYRSFGRQRKKKESNKEETKKDRMKERKHVKSQNPFVWKARESFWIQQYEGVRHGLLRSEYFLFGTANLISCVRFQYHIT